jgi:hypothetical protein
MEGAHRKGWLAAALYAIPVQRGRRQPVDSGPKPVGAGGASSLSARWGRWGGCRVGPLLRSQRRRFDFIQIRIQTKSNSIQIIPNFDWPKKDLPEIEKVQIK